MNFDLVSDLHIDQWSEKYNIKYPHGEVKEHPVVFSKTSTDYLIVAGDVSDDINLSISYLNYLSKFYKKILFVDGNHEHVFNYPKLFNHKEISNLISNDKIIYLSQKPYIINNTLFIGSCGWWDYNKENKQNIENAYEYFDNWLTHLDKDDSIKFIDNVIEKSKEEFEYLNETLKKYENDNSIENIVLVTHTVPKIEFCTSNNEYKADDFSTQYNSKYDYLFNYKKLTHWIFGHTHHQWDLVDNKN